VRGGGDCCIVVVIVIFGVVVVVGAPSFDVVFTFFAVEIWR
jgi:hypothetical protein